jgi:hypothetical protein
MFYSILLLLSGIYIGQEYHNLPSVRVMSIVIFNYLKNLKNDNVNNDNNNNNNDNNDNNDNNNNSYYSQLFSYFLKTRKDE